MDKELKIKLTRKQMKTLDDVFNFGLNYIEQTCETTTIFREGKDGMFVKFEYKDFEKDVLEVADILKKYIEEVKDGQDGTTPKD